MKHTAGDLRQLQSLPLEAKVRMTLGRARIWYDRWDGKVYIAFSGGKDSLVLLILIRSIFPDVVAVFVNTGLAYPETIEFVKTIPNVIWLRPDMNFMRVVEKYGYPVASKMVAMGCDRHRNAKTEEQKKLRLWGGVCPSSGKQQAPTIPQKWHKLTWAPFKVSDKCCDVMKKRPFAAYEKETGEHPFIGTMASESRLREQQWMKYGCNAFDLGKPKSAPLSFWLEEDIWAYLKQNNVPYSRIYDMGEKRTGCMFCMFGVHMEKGNNRFQRMQKTHPKQWKFCMDTLGLREVLKYIGVPCEWRDPDPMLFDDIKP
ncbi:MAG: phosphoadenosine phosphosulfate reductase family protein [Gammaproteobacteria bacterium]|nr:phosphoadenosine phosphosulfate reductase family protein [Gammaproteobacteria bacterium]